MLSNYFLKKHVMATKMRTGRLTVKKTNGDPVKKTEPIIGSSKQTGSQNIASAQALARKQWQLQQIRSGETPESVGMSRDSLIASNPVKWGYLKKEVPSTKKTTTNKPTAKITSVNKQTGGMNKKKK